MISGILRISLLFFLFHTCQALVCYECSNCGDIPLRHLPRKRCDEDENTSCMMTVAKFAHYRTISRRCSKAPVLNLDGCVSQTINIMRTEICICGKDLCNGEYKATEISDQNVNASAPMAAGYSIFLGLIMCPSFWTILNNH
ncbi:uncharacterized protein LOC131879503 isoform X1 [Tigriopus californicus]|uniref:uncharacterized protein LOC131879503 isoform X1 n=1 Tax=Tigriopus californicus TaxID=6832 RepID=UPI0027DAAC0E|nr:uncharacterized protein LOC131879503 isoform X1 [Tigriopus californicus]